MIAEIIAVGSELVNGEKLDTNSQWLSRALGKLGVSVHFHTTLGDDLAENVAAFQVAKDRANLVIVTGGLGPTQDDLTREALAEATGEPLAQDEESLKAIVDFFERRGRVMTDRNRVQAMLPFGSEPLPNRVGTAPGIWMRHGDCTFACLPGVPYEMRLMFEEQVDPRLRALGAGSSVILHRVIPLFGKGEAEIESMALDLTARGRDPEVGITAHDATISFRVSTSGATEAEALARLEPTLAIIRERFGDLVLGDSESVDVPEAAVNELARTHKTLATAESCTGGLIAHQLTKIAGVSEQYLGGVVSYANHAKVAWLGVPDSLIAKHGAVSPEVAEAMAIGARTAVGADIGLSVTGVAGPGGGTAEKPVGLVYIGLADAQGASTRRLSLGAEQPRHVIQSRSAKHALNWVRLHLLKGETGR
jgi:nicotinamide-nucleotide amidase